MKRSFAVFALVFLAAVTAGGQELPETGSKRGQEVVATIAKWADAVRDRDVKALDSIFDDEVIITTYDGKTRGKAEELGVMKPSPNFRMSSVANEDMAIKLFGDVAVVTALTKMKMIAAGGRESSLAMRYTAVFVKKDGNWRIVALQTARAPQ
ncbi:MAG: nuclear transport factor 2 family protein [Pyrinomonadaceae bacterium]